MDNKPTLFVEDGAPTVLYFSSSSHWQGGAAQLMFRTARWLRKQGSVPVVVLPERGDLVDWYDTEGIEVIVIPFERMHRRWNPLYLVCYLFSTISIIFRLASLIKRQHIDIVHVNEIVYFPGLIAGKIAGAKTICHVRVIITKPVWIRRMLVWIAQYFSDLVLCESKAVERWMFPAQAVNIRTLYPPGPDMERFDPNIVGNGESIRRELGIAQDTFVVGLVSKFVFNKGQLALVEAARVIKARKPNLNIRYLMVGGKIDGHDGYFAKVCSEIERHSLGDSFILTGARKDVPRLIACCDVLVHLPQHEDPCPGVVMEAMAMKKPVVAFASGGTPEQFEDGKSGILVMKNDTETLVEALLTLVENEALRLDMGREAKSFLTSRFSYDKFFSELSSVYAGLLAVQRQL